jgi:hypothetical protein
VKSSLLSAVAGWLAGVVAFPLAEFIKPSYALNGIPQRLPLVDLLGSAVVAAIYSAPAILAVWLLLLWPLYRIVPIKSVLWRPAICISCGAVAGAVLYYICGHYIFGFSADFARSIPQPAVGAAVGAVTCAVGARLKHRENKTSNQSLEPTAGRRGVQI